MPSHALPSRHPRRRTFALAATVVLLGSGLSFAIPIDEGASRAAPLPSPALSLQKSASPAQITTTGDQITYSFLVTNTGNVALDNLVVSDSQTPPAGALDGPVSCPTTTLAPGASTTCQATYTTTTADADNGTVSDTAVATADPPTGPAVTSNQSSATVSVLQTETMSIATTPSPTVVSAVGQQITFSFLVTNTGNVSLRNVRVSDFPQSPAGSLDGPVTCAATTLLSHQSTTCTGTYTVTQADLDHGRIDNLAIANGDPPNGDFATAMDRSTVNVQQSPALSMTKSASPTTVGKVGDTITYTFAVRNTGNVTLTNVTIADTQSAPAGALDGPVSCPATTLAPGATTNCSATYTVSQADLDNGSVDDTATASATSPSNQTVQSAPSGVAVTAQQGPAIALTKSTTSTPRFVGDPIDYQFLVSNTGNVTLSSIVVDDEQGSPSGPVKQSVSCPATALAPGASMTCTAQYDTTQADVDAGSANDTATVSGSIGNTTVQATSSLRVPITAEPHVTLTKSASPQSGVNAAGDPIAYVFNVFNDGNVTLNDIALSDQETSPPGPALSVSCPQASLASAHAMTCYVNGTATQAEIDNGVIADTATVTARDPSNTLVTSTSSARIPVNQRSALSVTKTASPASVDAVGQTITYSFAVQNTGNVTLTGLSIADAQNAPAGALDGPISCPVTTLAPGASTTCTGTYTVTQQDLDNGSVDDSATASAVDPSNAAVQSGPSQASVAVAQAGDLTLTKTPTPAQVTAAGQVVDYALDVQNTGNVTLSDLTVLDAQRPPATGTSSAVTCPQTTLAPSDSMTCHVTYTVTQADIDNAVPLVDDALAFGTTPQNDVALDTASATVAVIAAPDITMVKSVDPSQTALTAVGDTVHYDFTVTDSGNTTLDAVAIEDAQSAPAGALDPGSLSCPQSTLAPAESMTCHATYTITQADVDNGAVSDTAVAVADASTTDVQSAPSSVSVPITQHPALTVAKSVDTAIVHAAGTRLRYSFVVHNTGTVTLTGVGVTDSQVAPAHALSTGPSCPEPTLPPGASETCTATYVVAAADISHGSITDSATAHATGPRGTAVTSGPSAVTVRVQLPPQPLATTGTAVQAAALYGMGLVAMGALFLIAGTRRPRNG